jgi:colanic acid biosynthesis glycosyl transferase WcaI
MKEPKQLKLIPRLFEGKIIHGVYVGMKDKKLKLLVYGINYYPELTGIGKYTGEMCEWLAERGHSIEVITAFPYYPMWKTDKKYQNKWWHTEKIKNVVIKRCPIYIPKIVTGVTRIFNDLSFFISSTIFWVPAFFKSYDAVIAIYPPLVTGIYPTLYKILRRKPFVLHVQDLQVDVAKELGIIKNKALLSFLEKIEKIYLKNASVVSSISPGMRDRLLSKGVKPSAYFSLPNWANVDFIKPGVMDEIYKAEMGYKKEDKIILYSGSLAAKQGLEILIKMGQRFISEKGIHFLIVGQGFIQHKLVDQARKLNLHNIKFYELQPYEKLPALLNMADLHLVIQKKAAADLVLPSKLVSILSAGGAAVVTAAQNTSLYQLIKEHELAILAEPEDEEALFHCLNVHIRKDNGETREKARNYALNYLEVSKILLDFENMLFSLSSRSN